MFGVLHQGRLWGGRRRDRKRQAEALWSKPSNHGGLREDHDPRLHLLREAEFVVPGHRRYLIGFDQR